MTDFSTLLKPDRGGDARTIHLVDKARFDDWAKARPADQRAWMKANGFDGGVKGRFLLLPTGKTDEFEIAVTVANVAQLTPWCLAGLAEALPEGSYRLACDDPGIAALGWLLAQHVFDRYKACGDQRRGPRILLSGKAARIERIVREAEATALVRDLVNTPAADLGPAELEDAVRDLAKNHDAKVTVTKGDALAETCPMIAAVGGGAISARAPRLIELEWGNPGHPRLALVGKGVCFDSGGLDIKPGSGMRNMKKDMGGAAHALALAGLVMSERLKVRLHLLIPAVENAISGAAYRPGDILKSRLGLTVEIDNTDAEGRLVLGDALAKAAESEPSCIIDLATLTGAARVAMGPDLPPFFANDEELAGQVTAASEHALDPLWRLPLWQPYADMLKSNLADIANSANSPMAGCITAALFLEKFVPPQVPWVHIDTYAWRDSATPGRPKGGEALGLRAMFTALESRFADD